MRVEARARVAAIEFHGEEATLRLDVARGAGSMLVALMGREVRVRLETIDPGEPPLAFTKDVA